MIDTLYSDTRSVSGLNASLDYPLLSEWVLQISSDLSSCLPSAGLVRSFLGQLDQWRADWTEGLNLDVTRRHVRGKAADAAAEQFFLNQARYMADFYHS